jgi:hypothetical protein
MNPNSVLVTDATKILGAFEPANAGSQPWLLPLANQELHRLAAYPVGISTLHE